MDGCADRGKGETWITEEMKAAYQALADQGHALAYEVLEGEELVGGLYGVRIRGLFAAESKFHRVSDASKVALVFAVLHSHFHGATCFDVQFLTPHLASLGVTEISRAEYLRELTLAMDSHTESATVPEYASPSPKPEDRDWMPWLLENLPNFRGAGPG